MFLPSRVGHRCGVQRGARRQHPSCRPMSISCGALRCSYRSQGISTSTDFSLQIVDNAVSSQTMRRRSRGAVAVRQLPVNLHFGLGVPGFQRVLIGTFRVHFFQTPTALLRVGGRPIGKSSLWNTRQWRGGALSLLTGWSSSLFSSPRVCLPAVARLM